MIKQVRLLSLLLFLLIGACRSTSIVQHIETKQYVFSDSSNTLIDSIAWKMIKPYHDSLDKIMNVVLAYTNQALIKGTPEGLLGDFAAESCSEQSKITAKKMGISNQDFTFLNNGGLRTSIPKGNITLRNIYEVMPFENVLVIVTLNGNQTNQLVNYIAEHGGSPVAGLQMKIDTKKAVEVKIDGNFLDSTKSYRVLTSDYLANGGDNLVFLKNAKKESLNLKVRDAMIYYLEGLNKKGDTLNIQLDGRIRNH